MFFVAMDMVLWWGGRGWGSEENVGEVPKSALILPHPTPKGLIAAIVSKADVVLPLFSRTSQLWTSRRSSQEVGE